MPTTRKTGLPLYQRCYQDLLRRIENGEFRPDDRLPTEEQLCREYEVSLITVRRAVAELARAGIARRRHGLGTFVIGPPQSGKSLMLMGRLESVMSHSTEVTHRLLSRRAARLAPELARAFGMEDEGMQRIDVIYLRGQPFSYTSIYAPRAVACGLDDAAVAQSHASVFHLLQDRAGAPVAHVDQTLDIAAAPKAAAAALGVKPGRPVQRALRAYYGQDGQAMFGAVVLYHPEHFRISMRFIP